MWLRAFLVYLACIAALNLVWETLHLPLYTIWTADTPQSQAFSVLHCTAGDLLIASGALVLALLLVGDKTWPVTRFFPVLSVTVGASIAYTIFSEWLNVGVRKSWAYSALMPIVNMYGLRIGASPLLQWLTLPSLSLLIARRLRRARA